MWYGMVFDDIDYICFLRLVGFEFNCYPERSQIPSAVVLGNILLQLKQSLTSSEV